MVSLLENPLPIPGGLVLESHKSESLQDPIQTIPLPVELIIPISQHIGTAAEPLVKIGQHVAKGEIIAAAAGYISAPIHASSSGTVTEIGEHPVPHPSGLNAICIRIKTDGEDRWIESQDKTDTLNLEPALIRQRVMDAGIVGLGGAGFPAAVKCSTGLQTSIELLILNAAECEPYISCDEALMRARPEEVIEGLRIMRHALRASHCVIGIEDNMPQAKQTLLEALDKLGEKDISIISVPTIYPAGGEKQLIYSLTGKEVPSNGLPTDIGMICHNVGTAVAVYRAVAFQEPLISRIVTVTGSGVKQPHNLDVLIGTPISHLVEFCGGYMPGVNRLLMGGPMMGFGLQSDDIPVIKTTNCLLATTHQESPEPQAALPCIRCGKCTEVCPAGLLPQQLYWFANTRAFDKIQEHDLFDCIECGCCAQVCPSHIPLVQYYRFAKTEIWEQETQREKSDVARQRFEFHEARLIREKQELAERRSKHKQVLKDSPAADKDAKKAAIQAALERVKAKKSAAQSTGAGEADRK
jgi:electron transport complex protein RnfC